MGDDTVIPDENIDSPDGSTGSLRPDDEEGPLVIPSTGPGSQPEVIIDLTSDDYPEAPELGDLTPKDTKNIDTFNVYYRPADSTVFVPIDEDGDGIPDVSSMMFKNQMWQ